MTVPHDPQTPRTGGGGLFLARERYRQRRLRDVGRVLPILGLVLWLVPLMWTREGSGGLAGTIVYIFVVWTFLILCAAIMARRIDTTDDAASPPEEPRG
ncbi:hypothetical protein [Loktanella sp. SALINAS62]|uniref:hypothetical protein n=1 Tax=Loktanella sp. SALINAS62 TaxID=2706124 RepID=UPI001B8C1CB2|nr:hypothetical protein [Loktanella sp. SALINAS62]MBS1303767.1 hypothetical protein [Loktanella sp. SALINAS62]